MAVDLKMASILKDPGTRVVICCGAGGVGKTTTAAAMAMYAAEQGRRVAVLTIDPARRLAQSLGMTALTNEPQPVQLNCAGSLDAMMLDMRRTFDDMVIEHSTPERAAAILENSFYQTMASSFSGTQEYMAMEKLGKLLSENRWDLIVVDTPPSRNALDFLDAPKRLGSFLSGRLMKMLVGGGRGVGRMVTGAMSLAMRGVSTIIGGDMLRDVATFVQSGRRRTRPRAARRPPRPRPPRTGPAGCGGLTASCDRHVSCRGVAAEEALAPDLGVPPGGSPRGGAPVPRGERAGSGVQPGGVGGGERVVGAGRRGDARGHDDDRCQRQAARGPLRPVPLSGRLQRHLAEHDPRDHLDRGPPVPGARRRGLEGHDPRRAEELVVG
ncbi:ArsA family ATPase [Gordonia amarae]|uniref:ArsA family ATPase n=1 Tax=Gordonia amarae TaxID=36821 RepID=UPI0037BE2B8B